MSQRRLKWMRLKIRTDSEEIFNFIRKKSYSDVIGAGFTKYETIHNGVSATFNRKSIVLEPVLDPFGDIFEFERIIFDQIDFSIQIISNRSCLLTFYNPPKTVKPLIDFLSSNDGVDIAYGNLAIDLRNFMKVIRDNFGVKIFEISKVKVSNIPVAEKTKATLELSSSSDALKDLKAFIGNDDFKLDRIKATGLFYDSKLAFEISSSASGIVPEQYFSIFNDTMIHIERDKL